MVEKRQQAYHVGICAKITERTRSCDRIKLRTHAQSIAQRCAGADWGRDGREVFGPIVYFCARLRGGVSKRCFAFCVCTFHMWFFSRMNPALVSATFQNRRAHRRSANSRTLSWPNLSNALQRGVHEIERVGGGTSYWLCRPPQLCV